ncbi:hypothetical protein [Sphingomonas sp. BK235]|jgi:hypothetical protein|uniref:hypothetical protein n=1 Tax=Sphingomonas sp. BK235 TaxID=2512131 RepID=UPI00104C3D2F|nr:hypothetical protein [Sphingomonas sp. BK235]TCP33630.1 hypothetical protein EV292_10579 [Sphingomonas sp. BK235]
MSGVALLLAGLGQALFGAIAPVPDATLAGERGGFMLPGGIDVALTVQTQTAVDGAVVLRTVFQASQGAPTLTVYAPRAGETVAAAPVIAARGGAASAPTVTYDSRNGLQVTPGSGAPALAAGVGTAAAAALPAGLEAVAGGATDHGVITQGGEGGVRTVQLSGSDLTVTHLAGHAFGSAIANAGSDRTIDTQTSVAIDLGAAGAELLAGSALLRVGEVAGAATAMRAQ